MGFGEDFLGFVIASPLKKPNKLPQKPPTMCANSLMPFSASKSAFNISRPRYSMSIKIKVSGISPRLKLVKDINRTIINATPEAPSRLVLKKTAFRIPVIKAVVSIIKKIVKEP